MNKNKIYYSVWVCLIVLSVLVLLSISPSKKSNQTSNNLFISKDSLFYGNRQDIAPTQAIINSGKILRLPQSMEDLFFTLEDDGKTIIPPFEGLDISSKVWKKGGVTVVNNHSFIFSFLQNNKQKKFEAKYVSQKIPKYNPNRQSSTTVKPYWVVKDISTQVVQSKRYTHEPYRRQVYNVFDRVTKIQIFGKEILVLTQDGQCLFIDSQRGIQFLYNLKSKEVDNGYLGGRKWANATVKDRYKDIYRSETKQHFITSNGTEFLAEFRENDPFHNMTLKKELENGKINFFRPSIDENGIHVRTVIKTSNGNVIYLGGQEYSVSLKEGSQVITFPVFTINEASEIVPTYFSLDDKYINSISLKKVGLQLKFIMNFNYKNSKNTGKYEVLMDSTAPFRSYHPDLPIVERQKIIVREYLNGELVELRGDSNKLIKPITGNWAPHYQSDSCIFTHYVRYPFEESFFVAEVFIPGRKSNLLLRHDQYVLKMRLRSIYDATTKKRRICKDREGSIYFLFKKNQNGDFVGIPGVKMEFTVNDQTVPHSGWENGFKISPRELSSKTDKNFVLSSTFRNIMRVNKTLYYIEPKKKSTFAAANLVVTKTITKR